MATALVYDAYEDVGLAFSEEEVEAYSPQALAEARRDHLLDQWAVTFKRSQLAGVEKPVWWKDAAKKTLDCAGWICVAVEVPAFDRDSLVEGLPAPETADGKKLARRALDLTPEDWLGAWEANAEACMRYTVTLGRRSVTKHKNKNTKRLSNKLANAIMREIQAVQRLESLLISRVGPLN